MATPPEFPSAADPLPTHDVADEQRPYCAPAVAPELEFEHGCIVAALDELIEKAHALPRYTHHGQELTGAVASLYVEAFTQAQRDVAEINRKLNHLVRYEGSRIPSFLEDVGHDYSNLLRRITFSFGNIALYEKQPARAAQIAQLKNNIPLVHDHYVSLLTDFLYAYKGLETGRISLQQTPLLQTFEPTARVIADRTRVTESNPYGVENVVVGEPPEELVPGTIYLDIDPTARALIDGPLISLAATNGIKNAFEVGKKAEMKVTVVVRVRETENGCTEIFIRDTGPGLSSDNEDIFKRGVSFKNGKGLGLDIVKRIVAMHNGSVEMYDNHDAGACLWIVLPNEYGSDPVQAIARVHEHKTHSARNSLSKVH